MTSLEGAAEPKAVAILRFYPKSTIVTPSRIDLYTDGHFIEIDVHPVAHRAGFGRNRQGRMAEISKTVSLISVATSLSHAHQEPPAGFDF